MINITLSNIKVVFNQKAILTPAEKAQNKILAQFGGYCRAVMRNSIKPARSRNQHAAPGQPPLYHSGPLNYRDTLFFVVDRKAKDVTIGGVLLSGTAAKGQPVPGILEEGGERLSLLSRAARIRGGKRVPGYIAAHPHAKPAFDRAVEKKLPDLIRGGIMREV